MLIDSHIHLYAEQFDEDRNALMAQAKARNILGFILPNVDGASISGMLELADKLILKAVFRPWDCTPVR